MSGRPNILFVTSDQHRAHDLGCAGHPCIRTPHLDQLAFEGIRFESAYTDCPVCIPARTTMITGIQSHLYGMPAYAEQYRIDRPPEQMLGGLMAAAGYHTQLMGKTHWHLDRDHTAGFESLLHDDVYLQAVAEATGRRWGRHGVGANECYPSMSQLEPQWCYTDWFIDRSIEWLDGRDDERPFFLWVSLHAPHPPLVMHEPFYSMYDNSPIPQPIMPDWADDETCPRQLFAHRNMYNPTPMRGDALRKARGVYYGMVTNIDFQLGRLFGYLTKHGRWDNTLVVYTTDHGEHLGDFGDLAKSNFLHTAGKLPFIIRPPREWRIEGGQVTRALVELADLLPTFCSVAGIDTPADVTGRDLLQIVRGERETVRDALHGQINECHMYHDGRYKYLYYTDDGAELVFDTVEDPRDEHDLSADDALRERLHAAFIEHLAGEPHGNLPERHRALSADGDLVNRREPRHTVRYWRAHNPHGWGGALAW